jgi:hypothetical protein
MDLNRPSAGLVLTAKGLEDFIRPLLPRLLNDRELLGGQSQVRRDDRARVDPVIVEDVAAACDEVAEELGAISLELSKYARHGGSARGRFAHRPGRHNHASRDTFPPALTRGTGTLDFANEAVTLELT